MDERNYGWNGTTYENEYEERFLENCASMVELSDAEKLSIYRNYSGRISNIQNVDLEERIIIQSIKNGYTLYYTLYAYRFQGEEELRELEKKLEELYEKYPAFQSLYYEAPTETFYRLVGAKRKSAFSVYDISARKEQDKKLIVQNFLLKERKNPYNPFVKYMLNVNVFKVFENEYFCVLSLCEKGEGLKRKNIIFNTLFRTEAYQHMEHVLDLNDLPVLSCANYWKSVLSELTEQKPPKMKYQNTGIGSELFVLDGELTKLLSSFSKESGIGLKELFFTIWGFVLSKYQKTEEMLIGDADEGGVLTVAPIRVRQTEDIKRLLFDIQEQLKQKKKFSGYSLEEFKRKQMLDIVKDVYVIQNFCEEGGNRLIATNIQEKHIYQVKPYVLPEVPLQIDYNISSASMRMVYTYNRRIYDNTDICNLHEVFQKLAKGMLEIIKEKSAGSIDEVTKQAMKTDVFRIIMNKAQHLKTTKLFTVYEPEKLLNFAQKCRLVDYQMGETILDEQIKTENLYVIAQGRVEVSRTNMESFLTPLQILKEGSVFGIESITKNAFSDNKYMAYTESVKLLEIPAELLKQEFYERPAMMLDFIEYQRQQLNKFQTLWIMG